MNWRDPASAADLRRTIVYNKAGRLAAAAAAASSVGGGGQQLVTVASQTSPDSTGKFFFVLESIEYRKFI